MSKSTPPAAGERAALAGYTPQYLLSAWLTLEAFRSQQLEWVKLADPDAGRLDDFQIGTTGRVDAYQFKWSTYPTTLSYLDLTKPTKAAAPGGPATPGLLAQLADGWMRLSAAHRDRQVVVHLVTNDNPTDSTSAVLPVGQPPPSPIHLAAFFAQAWPVAKAAAGTVVDAVPPAWRETLLEFLRTTGLAENQFDRFVSGCEVRFGQGLPDPPSDPDGRAERQDLDRLRQLFQDVVASDRKEVTLSAAELLRRLGWTGRTEFRNRHEFPDPAIPYSAIEATVDRFEDLLTHLRRGYVAVVGPPGSGKSTLLTRTLRRPRPERVVRYYAFVPDAQTPGESRGEAVNFFHDVGLALARSGVGGSFRTGGEDLRSLRDEFGRALTRLCREFVDCGRRTILLIDGLDHIDRELRPVRSLLAELPPPAQVPDGVLIVLGTQSDQLPDLPLAVRSSLDDDGRRITITPLTRSAVAEIARRAQLPYPLSAGQLDRLFELSDGHPLALKYLLATLGQTKDADGVDAILAGETPYRGDIEAVYRPHWEAIRGTPRAAEVMAAVCRLRTAPTTQQLDRWFGPAVVAQVAETLRRYLRVDTDGRWRLFHNSFRLFLERETCRSLLTRVVDPAVGLRTHRELAELCAGEEAGSTSGWDELFHRLQAGDHQSVCRLATTMHFRRQLAHGRPLEAIQTDTRLARRSAAHARDPIAYARLALAEDEWERRGYPLRGFALPTHWLWVRDTGRAVEAIRDGNRLRVSDEAALGYAEQLHHLGLTEEGRRIFDLAEPLEGGEGERRLADEVWKHHLAWARAAPLFRPLEEIFARIAESATPRAVEHGGDADEAARRWRARLTGTVGRRLISLRRWEDVTRVADRLVPGNGPEDGELFYLLLEAAHEARRAGGIPRRDAYTRRLRDSFPDATLGDDRRILIAELLAFAGDHPSAGAVLGETPPTAPDFDPMSRAKKFDRFAPLYRYARLKSTLGDRRAPMQLVPSLDPKIEDAVRYFLSDVVLVAQLDATGGTDDATHPSLLSHRLSGLLRRFDRDPRETRHWYRWHDCQAARCELYGHLVRAVAKHGTQALAALRDQFLKIWAGEGGRHWWPAVRREIAVAFALTDPAIYRGWAAEVLDGMEAALTHDTDPHGAVDALDAQAEAWASIGRPDRVGPLYGRVVGLTARLSGEDYQMEDWLRLFEDVAGHRPDEALAGVERIACGLYGVRESADRRPITSAAARLLRLAARLDATTAVRLFARFRDHGLLPHTEGLVALVSGLLDCGTVASARLAAHVIGDLVVPFEPTPDGRVVAAVVRVAHAQGGVEEAEGVAGYLTRRIARYGYPRARSGWWEEAGVAIHRWGLAVPNPDESTDEPDADPTPATVTASDADRGKLTFGETTFLTSDEVLGRVSDPSRLIELAKAERYDSRFDWSPVLDRYLDVHGQDELARFVEQTSPKSRVAVWLIARARGALGRGERERASAFARLVFPATTRTDWSRRFSAGHRLDACRVLVEADPRLGAEGVWQALEADPCPDPAGVVELMRLVRGGTDPVELWELVEDRLQVVFDSAAALPPPATPLATHPGTTPNAALAVVLVDHIDHPVHDLRIASRRACAHALREGDVDLTTAVRAALAGNEFRVGAAVELLAVVGHAHPPALRGFIDDLRRLCLVEDLTVAVTARRLCVLAGEAPPPRDPRPLPADYSRLPLRLPRGQVIAPREMVDGEPLPDTDEPVQLLAMVSHVIRAAADEADIEPGRLFHRAAGLMRQVSPQESWLADGERRVREWLDNAGLKWAYIRPRSRVANHAVRRLLGELWRGGRLTDEAAERLADELRFSDPALFLIEPARRPQAVAAITGLSLSEALGRTWLGETANDAAALPAVMPDGRVILAEATEQEYLARMLRTEIRVAAHTTAGGTVIGTANDDGWFPCSPDWRVASYPDLTPTPESAADLVVRHQNLVFDSPGSGWLAFNPATARQLGWQHSPDGLFRWIDAVGNVLVESVWWADGPVGDRDSWSDQTVGRGWLVVASGDAVTQISTVFGPLRQRRLLTRTCRFDDGEESTTATG